jgi:hypothetical protein
MKHMEAVERLKVLAKGRPWSLQHNTASYNEHDGVEIAAYIEKCGFGRGPTYERAISSLEAIIRGDKPDPAPEDEGEDK